MRLEAQAIKMALAGLNYEIELTGIGAKRLPDLKGRKNSCLIMAGLCGALDPALKIGDLLLDSESEFQIANLKSFHSAKLHTADHVISTIDEKAGLFRSTGAAAVDMENAIVRNAARNAGLPFIGIRAVSDTADQALDPAVLKLCDEIGRPKPLAAMSLIIRRPAIISKLRQLQSQSQIASAALGRGVRFLVEALASPNK